MSTDSIGQRGGFIRRAGKELPPYYENTHGEDRALNE
jgi:hypothetical protein